MTDRTPVLIERLTKCEGMITKSGAVNVSATLGLLIEARDALAERAAMPTRNQMHDAYVMWRVGPFDPATAEAWNAVKARWPDDAGYGALNDLEEAAFTAGVLFARNQTDGETKP